METIWSTIIGRKYESVIDSLETALRDCPAELWEASLWEVRKDQPYVWPVRTVDAKEGVDAADQERLLQVFSAYWNVTYHTLFHLDFYLSGAISPYTPPPPFREDENQAYVVPNRTYTRAELQSYREHISQKAQATFSELTDAQAVALLPQDSHHAGKPFAELLLHNLLHAQEHAAQLSLFLGQRERPPGTG